MKLLVAIILFIAGLVLAVVTARGYSKAKSKADDENTEFDAKPYIKQLALTFVCFIIAQILLWLN